MTTGPVNVARRLYVTRSGDTLTHAEVVEACQRRHGSSESVVDHLRVGGIYCNGPIWVQRVYDNGTLGCGLTDATTPRYQD